VAGVELLDAALPAPARGAFTTRLGGVSAPPWAWLNLGLGVDDEWRRVHANRDLLRAALGADQLVFAQQVHGAGVAVVERAGDRARNGGVAGVDALVTATPGLGLVALAADCLPVLLADAGAGVVAAAHAGRAGLLAGVLQRTVEQMTALGGRPERTTAVVGPAAGPCCYEVPEQMAADAETGLPGVRAATRQGTPSLDLLGGARLALRQAGVTDTGSVDACTIEDGRFFSYRRDGRTGRHAGVVLLAA